MLPPDLVAKLQQCAANDFAGPRDHWFSRLAAFTTSVFFGLVLELPELRYELKLIARDWIPYFRYRILTPSEHRLHAAKVVAFIGWLLIVIGVGGERYSEVRVKDLDASIQECGEAKVRAATLEAGDAAKSAKTAHDEADAASEASKKALDKSSTAMGAAGEAQREAGEAAKQVADLNGKLQVATTQLEAVDAKRAALEKSLKNLAGCSAPRVIPVWSARVSQKASTFNEALLPFHDFTVLIEYRPNDGETLRAASSLARVFGSAGWTVLPLRPSPEEIADGVEVQAFEPSDEDLKQPNTPTVWSAMHAQKVAGKVVAFLHSYNWEAKLNWMSQEDAGRHPIPQQGIRILVGLYPPVWFVAPRAMNVWAEAIAERDKQQKEREQAAEEASRASDAKILAQLSPQMAERYKAEKARFNQERRDSMEPYTRPCQPLESLGPY